MKVLSIMLFSIIALSLGGCAGYQRTTFDGPGFKSESGSVGFNVGNNASAGTVIARAPSGTVFRYGSPYKCRPFPAEEMMTWLQSAGGNAYHRRDGAVINDDGYIRCLMQESAGSGHGNPHNAYPTYSPQTNVPYQRW
jgi:hypothetical protein